MDRFLSPQEIADNHTAHLAELAADLKKSKEETQRLKDILVERDRLDREARAVAGVPSVEGVAALESSFVSRQDRMSSQEENDLKEATLLFGPGSNGAACNRLALSDNRRFKHLRAIAIKIGRI
jgi:hypothetical protein